MKEKREADKKHIMKKPTLRTFAIWLLMLTVGIAAFTLALNITGNSLEYSEGGTGIVIDLDQDPYDIATTQESSNTFWQGLQKQDETEGNEAHE